MTTLKTDLALQRNWKPTLIECHNTGPISQQPTVPIVHLAPQTATARPQVTLPALEALFSLKAATRVPSAPYQVGHPKDRKVHYGIRTCLDSQQAWQLATPTPSISNLILNLSGSTPVSTKENGQPKCATLM